ncbi:MAG: ribonuclease HII [Patescibacteria group bacterium]|nr:ribonuclease HII [Patescibacteria group bacterium]MBU1870755.1 ribonuclease HII [Patescibacteria group bacterium]
MLDFSTEKEFFNQGYKLIAAIDEAGRGPLAGPVVAACVIFRVDQVISEELKQINDSKKLSLKKREALYLPIKQAFFGVGVGICDNQTIDRINILQASFLAMKKALGSIKLKPDLIILDGGFKIPNLSISQKAIVKGDEKVLTIAAASIIAKVERDRLMIKFHQQYPQYGFDQHKGYGTKLHLERLKQHGPCLIHRLSFARVLQK